MSVKTDPSDLLTDIPDKMLDIRNGLCYTAISLQGCDSRLSDILA